MENKKISSIHNVLPQADFPIFENEDTDLDAHDEDFEELCNLANPVSGVSVPGPLRLLGVEPFSTCACSNRERLLEAVLEIGLAQPRQRQLSSVCGTTATARKFGEVLSEELGARVLPSDLEGLSGKDCCANPPPHGGVREQDVRGLREEGAAGTMHSMRPRTSPHLRCKSTIKGRTDLLQLRRRDGCVRQNF